MGSRMESAETMEEKTGSTCPTCRKKGLGSDNPFMPFCSERCRLIDLGNWASGQYRIAGERNDVNDRPDEEKNDLEGR